jgi:hypothetical protein
VTALAFACLFLVSDPPRLGIFNVFLPLLLTAAPEKNNDDRASPSEVNPLAWTEIDAKFADSFTYAFYIRRIAQRQTLKVPADARVSMNV